MMATTDADNAPGDLFVSVDVGTGSVRAALVDASGTILKTCEHAIKIFEPQSGFYEQSSGNIWEACRSAVKGALGNVNAEKVKGIGFDATCSLVVLDDKFQPITVSPIGCPTRNIVMWMDHRAERQANIINATKHKVLEFVGGQMSLEMEPPKLLWLKQNIPDTWTKAGHFLDLADFLTWKATGATSRSLCTLVCKWGYQANAEGARHWDDSFWKQIGLGDLVENNYAKIGTEVLEPGHRVGNGLCKEAAQDLGLCEGTAVGTCIIDAHAGGVGMMACSVEGLNLPCEDKPITSRLPIICGTSSCHMAVSQDPLFVPGVWGPYYSAVHPGLWTNEGGQSITGKLIDHVLHTHPAFKELEKRASKSGESVYESLNNMLPSIAALRRTSTPATLTKDMHMWPDYHGNRSPLADPTLKGMISGLTLSTEVEDLAVMYLATIQALAHGTKHIIDAMESSGHKFSTLFACGGLSKNTLFLQVHADITGLPVVLPKESECVLVGSAILGAAAAGQYNSVQEAMSKMSRAGSVVWPNTKLQDYYSRKHRVYLKMLDHQLEYRHIMQDA